MSAGRALALALALAVGALTLAGSARAWLAVGESETTAYFLDPDTIRVHGTQRRVWRLFEYKQAQSNGIRSGKALIEIDCDADTYRYLRTMYYSEPQGRGKLLGGARERPKEHIAPGTMVAQLAKATCQAPGAGTTATAAPAAATRAPTAPAASPATATPRARP